MTAMFPDSGVPALDAKNSLLDPDTVNCQELWYSTSRCSPRFDPAAANAMLSELINAVNCAGIPYDCSKLDNLCDAIRYLIQQGDSWCAPLTGGPNDYLGTLNPPLLEYPADTCCLTIKVIPNVANGTPVRLNLDGLGFKDVVRNDGKPLLANDWMAGIPTILVYCGGRWVNISYVTSQVPKPLTAQLDIWVNNAIGNDANDGLSNTVGHALNTFQRAVDMAFNFQPGPYPVAIHIMNGAGPYAGAVTPNYAGPSLRIYGEGINTKLIDIRFCFHVQGPNNAVVNNISVASNGPVGSGGTLSCGGGASLLVDMIYAQACNGGVVQASRNGSMVIGRMNFYGSSYCLYYLNLGGTMDWTEAQQTAAAALAVTTASVFCGGAQGGVPSSAVPWVGAANVSGSKYLVGAVGMIEDQTAGNNWFPGTIAGSVANGGQYI